MAAMFPASWRSPAAGARSFRRSICSPLSSILSAAVFSSTRATRLVPGIGAMSLPCASSQTSAICAALQRGEWVYSVRAADRGGTGLRQPDVANLPLGGDAHIRRATIEDAGAAAGRDDAELRGQDHLVAAVLDRPADELLVGVRAVDLGGVELRDAEVQRPVDGVNRLGVAAGSDVVVARYRHHEHPDPECADGHADAAYPSFPAAVLMPIATARSVAAIVKDVLSVEGRPLLASDTPLKEASQTQPFTTAAPPRGAKRCSSGQPPSTILSGA